MILSFQVFVKGKINILQALSFYFFNFIAFIEFDNTHISEPKYYKSVFIGFKPKNF